MVCGQWNGSRKKNQLSKLSISERPFRYSITKMVLFTTQTPILTTLKRKTFENIVGKGENARNEQFLLSHSVFYPFR